MCEFKYQKLPESGSAIRLLRLLPSTGKTDPIQCEIFDTILDEATALPYEALSYVWGNTQDGRVIEVGQSTLRIGRNLFEALQALRASSPTASRTIWVDAICINQADVTERAQQVRIMWKIYSGATRTTVWLGPADADSDLTMSNFSRKETQIRLEARKVRMPRPDHYRGNWCGCHAGDLTTWPPTEGFQELLKRSWFRRVWVLQEVAASKNLLIACGDGIVSSYDFYREVRGIVSFYSQYRKFIRQIEPVIEIMNPDPGSAGNQPVQRPLVELMEIFRSWEATDPRDKVFALLGLSSDAHDGTVLPPDYTLSKHDLARKLIQFYLPSCRVERADLETITFEVEGFVIGRISGRWSGSAKRRWMFRARQYSQDEDQFDGKLCPAAANLFAGRWEIFIMNERKLPITGLVCLLRGATRPTILIRRGDGFELDTLATPEPIHDGKDEATTWTWMEAVEALESETEGLITFRLTWEPYSPLARHQISGYKVLYPDAEELPK